MKLGRKTHLRIRQLMKCLVMSGRTNELVDTPLGSVQFDKTGYKDFFTYYNDEVAFTTGFKRRNYFRGYGIGAYKRFG